MGLTIRNPEVERLARELAARRNISVTEAIHQSLRREVERDNIIREAVPNTEAHSQLFKDLIAISDAAARIPRVSDLSEDEILGYDEFGVPELPKSMR